LSRARARVPAERARRREIIRSRGSLLFLEITPDKSVVWTYGKHDVLQTAWSVFFLDPSGRPPDGVLVH